MTALAGRTHQQLVLELRSAPPQHRRFIHQRLADIDLAVTCIPTIALAKRADRWTPHPLTYWSAF